MKRKMKQTSETYVVIHKNPASRQTNKGKQWAVDGLNRNWNYAQAEQHAKRCEYGPIPYQVVLIEDVGKYVPSLQSKDDENDEEE